MATLNLDQAREWLEILYGDTPGMLHVCGTNNWTGFICSGDDKVETALDNIQRLHNQGAEGIYLRACTLKATPPEGGRGGDDLSFYLPGLWADIDMAGPGHKSKGTLPPTVEEAMRIVEVSGLPAPSHWIHSGGGLYPWWLLKDPHLIDDLEDVRSLSAGWQQALLRGAQKIGYAYGSGVGDLSRVLRIPGTVNRKEGLERPCGPLEGHAWSGELYTYERLVDALAAVTPAPPPIRAIEAKFGGQRDGERPGDEFNRTADWYDILLPKGWQWVRRMGDTWYLRRPGKMSGGHSATLRVSTDRLYVFSEEAQPFEPFKLYDKFSAYVLLEHGGDFGAAARELGRRGYGDQSVRVASGKAVPMEHVGDPDAAQTLGPNVEAAQTRPVASPRNWQHETIAPHIFRSYPYTSRGAGDMFADAFHELFKFHAEEKLWWFFDGRLWRPDRKERHEQAGKILLTQARREAERRIAAEEKGGEELQKFVNRMENAVAPSASRWGRQDPRVAVDSADFDPQRHWVAVGNGMLHLKTREFEAHDPKFMATKMLAADFVPDATAARWQRFLEEVLPDPDVRDYVQRAAGHALLGDAEQRALFLLHGESGSGKSQFIKVLELLFGDYAETAAAATFSASSRGQSLTNDLNDLRGKRFVSLSETDQDERMNESLLKRITGGDTAKSRGLYRENSKWRVEFSLWMATNYLPRINSDDNAIWRRLKPIEFPNVISRSGTEEKRLGEKMFEQEASGILNWLLDGVDKYLTHELEDTLQITSAVESYRAEVDDVTLFVKEATSDGSMRQGAEERMPVRQGHQIYVEWCKRNNIRHWLGERRFAHRMESAGFPRKEGKGGTAFTGIGPGIRGMFGTMNAGQYDWAKMRQ